MESATRLKRLALGGSLATLLFLVMPDTASAYGYYHYLAWDTYHENVWPSSEPIQRMYWHHTDGGFGVSIKCDVAGIPFGWVWFPISDDGTGSYVGYANKWGCYLAVDIIRFNGQNGAFTLDPITNPYAWTSNAWVRMVVIYDWEVVGSADGVLTMDNDGQNWW